MDPTVVLGGRANYGERVDKINPQFSLLATDRWDTGIGEIGALLNGTYSNSDYYRASTVLFQRRSTNTGPFNTPGYVLPRSEAHRVGQEGVSTCRSRCSPNH